jgi:hypothetical protein
MCAGTPISASGDVAFVCLVNLRSYYSFITDDAGNLLRSTFEANVRDYQGRTQVNEQIGATLAHGDPDDFWWLNNGITILAKKASQSGKKLIVEDPEIVNGLQTSTEIHKFFTSSGKQSDDRNILVRVIVPGEEESRDRIIRATNSQTAIPPASLRATDKIHRDIEEYLKPYRFYYDRRKNYYKNQGMAIDRIVGIPQMAQAVMSILLRRPDTARARPSSLIKDEEEYQRLFDQRNPIALYRVCASIMRWLNDRMSTSGLESRDRNNLKFYIAMVIGSLVTAKPHPVSGDLVTVADTSLTQPVFEDALKLVSAEYKKLGATDQVAKGPELLKVIEKRLNAKLAPTRTSSSRKSSA